MPDRTPVAQVVGSPERTTMITELLTELGVGYQTHGEVPESAKGCVVLIGSDYPEPTTLDERSALRLRELLERGGTVYAEYATDPIGVLPTITGPPRTMNFERIFVPAVPVPELTGDSEPLTIFDEHSSVMLPIEPPRESMIALSYGTVAGVRSATFGPPEESWPALIDATVGSGRLVYASTALSNADRGRYRPVASWRRLLRSVLRSVTGSTLTEPARLITVPRVWADSSMPVRVIVDAPEERRQQLDAVAVVGTEHQLQLRSEAGVGLVSEPLRLPTGDHELAVGGARTKITIGDRKDKVRSMIDRGMAWFDNAGLLFDASDGSAGVAEGFSNELGPDGRHRLRPTERADGFVQVAYAYHLYYRLTGEQRYATVATNLITHVAEQSQLLDRNALHGGWEPRGPRTELSHTNNLFADDGGWISLFCLAFGGTGDPIDLGPGLRGVESMIRSGDRRYGLQTNPWRTPAVVLATGWQGLADARFTYALDLSSHWNSSALGALWYAYGRTGAVRYRDLATAGLDHFVDGFPETRLETSRTCEMIRLLLPLAAGYRYTGNESYRRTMIDIAVFLDGRVDPDSGAIAEIDGRGPTSNRAYGTDEASIFQTNEDTVTDQLYGIGYAAMTLPIAARICDDPRLRRLSEQVLDYLGRIQLTDAGAELDGSWMRAFDYGLWDYFGSNCDVGWGPYCLETGWLHAPAMIGAMLWLTGDEFFPEPPATPDPRAELIKNEFDAIAQGRPAEPIVETRDDGRVVRRWTGPDEVAQYSVVGEVIAAGPPVWVRNDAAEAYELYVRCDDGGIRHCYLHDRLGEGRWLRIGDLRAASDPVATIDPLTGAVLVEVEAVDGGRCRSAMIDPRSGHRDWEPIGEAAFTGVPAYVYDPELGTARPLPKR